MEVENPINSSDNRESNRSPKPATPPFKRNPRLIVRLGIFLILHSTVVSQLCCVAGFLSLLFLPLLAKNTYISENALMPGSASPIFSGQDVNEASKMAKEILGSGFEPEKSRKEIPRMLAQHMANLGAEVYHHEFHSQINQFNPINFFSDAAYSDMIQDNTSCFPTGISTVGIIRAPRGDGKEAIVLVTPYNSERLELRDALSLGLGYSVFSLLSKATWLAKDIVWLTAESRYGEHASVSAWLRDYYNPDFRGSRNLLVDACLVNSVYNKRQSGDFRRTPDVFKRAGTMAAALILRIIDGHEEDEKDTLRIYAEASNGQMPNLDLINIVHYLAVYRHGLRVEVAKSFSLLNSAWIKFIGELLEWLSNVVGIFNSQWRFGIPASDYVDGAATLVSSIYNQALGVPTGPHGAFHDYQIDAITLEFSPKVSLNNEADHSTFLLRGGRLLEGVVRSVNNLLEKFHQSFFLYFLTSPSKFVSVGVYMIGFGLLILPLPVVAAALYSGNKLGDNNKANQSPSNSCSGMGLAAKSWRWLHAARVVLIVHLWGVCVLLLPHFIYQLPRRTSQTSMLSWAVLSTFILISLCKFPGSICFQACNVTVTQSENADWAILKAVTVTAAAIGLGVMSIVNFAAAQIGAMFLVPMCLIVHPLKLTRRVMGLKAILIGTCNLVLMVVGFPPFCFIIFRIIASKCFGGLSFGDFWDWMESLWAWNSATYLYLMLVHLPCWVLCMYILLLPL